MNNYFQNTINSVKTDIKGIFDPNANMVTGENTEWYWKNQFYNNFFNGMENYFQKGSVDGTQSSAKTQASTVNSLFYRVPLFHEDVAMTNDKVNTKNTSAKMGNVTFGNDPVAGQQGGQYALIHYLKNARQETGIIPTFINYNKYHLIQGLTRNDILKGENSHLTEARKKNPINDTIGVSFESEWDTNDPNKFGALKGLDNGSMYSDFGDNGAYKTLLRNRVSNLQANTYSNRLTYFSLFSAAAIKAKDQAETERAVFAETPTFNKDAQNQRAQNAKENADKRSVSDKIREERNLQPGTAAQSFGVSVANADDESEGAIAKPLVNWNTWGVTDVYNTKKNLDKLYDLSFTNILENFSSTALPNMQLKAQDFAYIDKLGAQSNNRLIVLRRYQRPVGNNPSIYPENMPISTLVGYYTGSLSIHASEDWSNMSKDFMSWTSESASFKQGTSLLSKFKFNPFTVLNDDSVDGTHNKGTLSAINDTLDIGNQLMQYGLYQLGFSQSPYIQGNWKKDPQTILGARYPKAHGLSGGIEFKFESTYIANYYPGSDPEQALLDIIANALAMFSSDSRFVVQPQSYTQWTQLNDIVQGKRGALGNAFEGAAGKATSGIMNLLNDTLSFFFTSDNDEESSAEGINKNKDKSALKESISDLIGKTGNYQYTSFESEFRASVAASTGMASAPWHVTIGNPMKPIICIGDLVCTGGTISFDMSELTFQDSPMKVKIACSLKPARQLGRQELEAILNGGFGRIYNDVSQISSLMWNNEIIDILDTSNAQLEQIDDWNNLTQTERSKGQDPIGQGLNQTKETKDTKDRKTKLNNENSNLSARNTEIDQKLGPKDKPLEKNQTTRTKLESEKAANNIKIEKNNKELSGLNPRDNG